MPDLPNLTSRTVFVIGGASGLGAAVAKLAAKAGAFVVVFDIAAPETGKHHYVDLRNPSSVEHVVGQTDTKFDLLVNSAGLPAGAEPADILNVNYLGQIQLAEALLANANHEARVFSIASIAGREWRSNREIVTRLQTLRGPSETTAFCRTHGVDGKAAYRLSKAALIHWTRQMTNAYQDNRISFVSVSPGPVNTELFRKAKQASPQATASLLAAAPRVAEPDEIADAILGLCRPEFGWLNGINIPLDGGADARFDAQGITMDILLNTQSEAQL